MPRWTQRTIYQRAQEKVEKADPNQCWIWTGAKVTVRGGYVYGIISRGTHLGWSYAHRVIDEEINGSIPEGWEVHHICEETLCCNPKHLRRLPSSEHILITRPWIRKKVIV